MKRDLSDKKQDQRRKGEKKGFLTFGVGVHITPRGHELL